MHPTLIVAVLFTRNFVSIVSSSADGLSQPDAQPATIAPRVRSNIPSADFNSASCTTVSCVAAGNFRDADGNFEAMTETSMCSLVTWAEAQPSTFCQNKVSLCQESTMGPTSATLARLNAVNFAPFSANLSKSKLCGFVRVILHTVIDHLKE